MTDTFHQRTTTAVNIFHTSVTNVCVGDTATADWRWRDGCQVLYRSVAKLHSTRLVAGVRMVGLSIQYAVCNPIWADSVPAGIYRLFKCWPQFTTT